MSEVYTTLPLEISLENGVKAPRWEIFLGNQSLEELKIKKLVSKIAYKSDLGKFDSLILTLSIASHSLVDARNIEDAIEPLTAFGTPIRFYIWDEGSHHEGAIHSMFANPKRLVHVGTLKTIKIAADKREATLEYAGLLSILKGDSLVFSDEEDINITYAEAIERLVTDFPNLTLQLEQGLAHGTRMTEVPDAGSTLNHLEEIAQTLGMHMRIKPDPTNETSYILHMGYLHKSITRDDWTSADAKKIMIINPNMSNEQDRKDYIHLATFNPEANFLGQEFDVKITSTNPIYGTFQQMEMWEEPTGDFAVSITIPYTGVVGVEGDAEYFNAQNVLMGAAAGYSLTRTWHGMVIGGAVGGLFSQKFSESPESTFQINYTYELVREGSGGAPASDEEQLAILKEAIDITNRNMIGWVDVDGERGWNEHYNYYQDVAAPFRPLSDPSFGGGPEGQNYYTEEWAKRTSITTSTHTDDAITDAMTNSNVLSIAGEYYAIVPNQTEGAFVNYTENEISETTTGMRSHSWRSGTAVVFEYAGITTYAQFAGAVEDDEIQEALEAAILNGKMGNFVQAKGCKLVEGNARLEVGTTWGLVVRDMPLFGLTFSSRYHISSVQHTISRGGGFETKFDCGSGQIYIPPATLLPPPVIDDGFPDEGEVDFSDWYWRDIMLTVPILLDLNVVDRYGNQTGYDTIGSLVPPTYTDTPNPYWANLMNINSDWWQNTMGNTGTFLEVINDDSHQGLYILDGSGYTSEVYNPAGFAFLEGLNLRTPLPGQESGSYVPEQVIDIQEEINSWSMSRYVDFLDRFSLTLKPSWDSTEDGPMHRKRVEKFSDYMRGMEGMGGMY